MHSPVTVDNVYAMTRQLAYPCFPPKQRTKIIGTDAIFPPHVLALFILPVVCPCLRFFPFANHFLPDLGQQRSYPKWIFSAIEKKKKKRERSTIGPSSQWPASAYVSIRINPSFSFFDVFNILCLCPLFFLSFDLYSEKQRKVNEHLFFFIITSTRGRGRTEQTFVHANPSGVEARNPLSC